MPRNKWTDGFLIGGSEMPKIELEQVPLPEGFESLVTEDELHKASEVLQEAIDSLKQLRKQLVCIHAFSDEYSETTCYRCGLEVNV